MYEHTCASVGKVELLIKTQAHIIAGIVSFVVIKQIVIVISNEFID